ncbi:hypothetical protein E6W39_11205 [Kitasatospora acidiphila]|uniref:Uncharacterized protein n=1 Tax=Kitasatospora acidiphila TaxID=2567942 RepID=A0A540W154_9ACTN|nr:hypothetical protein [Kitasatospora acidiphila]TQF02723.1 hypothetical protein E6W39_11205 [Kitasatospora acidiphila]
MHLVLRPAGALPEGGRPPSGSAPDATLRATVHLDRERRSGSQIRALLQALAASGLSALGVRADRDADDVETPCRPPWRSAAMPPRRWGKWSSGLRRSPGRPIRTGTRPRTAKGTAVMTVLVVLPAAVIAMVFAPVHDRPLVDGPLIGAAVLAAVAVALLLALRLRRAAADRAPGPPPSPPGRDYPVVTGLVESAENTSSSFATGRADGQDQSDQYCQEDDQAQRHAEPPAGVVSGPEHHSHLPEMALHTGPSPSFSRSRKPAAWARALRPCARGRAAAPPRPAAPRGGRGRAPHHHRLHHDQCDNP